MLKKTGLHWNMYYCLAKALSILTPEMKIRSLLFYMTTTLSRVLAHRPLMCCCFLMACRLMANTALVVWRQPTWKK